MRRALTLAVLLGLGPGCAMVHANATPTSSEVLPYHHGAVRVSALADPRGARELGAVEVSGEDTLDVLMAALIEQVRSLGGNVARIDGVVPMVETRMRTAVQAVPCFGMRFQAGCSQTFVTPEEVPMLRITGRAMRVDRP